MPHFRRAEDECTSESTAREPVHGLAGPWLGAVLASTLVLISACSLWPGSAGESDSPFEARRPTTVGVVVENQHWSDMVVYVVASGTSRRLGMVTTANRESFELSQNLLTGSLYLRAEAVGSSRSIQTDLLNVGEGDVVVWTIANQLGLSNYVIR